MSKKDNEFRKFQRLLRDKSRSATLKIRESGLPQKASLAASTTTKAATETYQNLGLADVVKPAFDSASEAFKYARTKAVEADENFNVSRTAKSVKHSVAQGIAEPAKKYLDDRGISEAAINVGRKTGDAYGTARYHFKPYFEPEDARELLENTRKELTYITACILQVSYREAAGWLSEFSSLLSAKIAGLAGTMTLFGLVSTFGTASTGTAIASLSGAAATSATLASIGSVVGGGMAAGALVMSGVGILIGIGAYKLLASTARDFDSLPDEDKQLVSTAGLLLTAIQEQLNSDPIELTSEDSALFLEQSLMPFHDYLVQHADVICSRLDTKNAIAYRQHVLKDFKPTVIDGFRHYSKSAPISAEALIAGIFYALFTNTALDDTREEALVLDALRRSTNSLHDASENDLANYLSSLTPEQLRGVANSVKGIYHEMRWIEEYNAIHTDTYAVLHESTVHRGADVQIRSSDSHEVIEEYQLKATGSGGYVREHLERYPDIEVLATSEVAAAVSEVDSSGFSNSGLSETTGNVFDAVADNTITDRVTESAELAGLVSAGREAISMLNGDSSLSDAGKRSISTVVQAAAATGITAYLFG
ncbi:conserved hypothetical protein [Luminiphilus syltensis NOR5-1B]|uniref:Uncharacterized protein n=1 Tax=Luminiphilus syltensis NOR5-1B TaxID=565045 RepID=B8KTD5_9GAMM|nr:hypothetical protein [Luminiphilus syltensis]EED34890.1 conserved hypothetical protein [Luminiphilus syltensis NOR5-1B]